LPLHYDTISVRRNNWINVLHMAKWQDLPREIHDRVLYWFCINTFHTFLALQASLKTAIAEYDEEGPESPAPLQHFANVLRTCEQFRDTIVNTLKINGRSVITILQEIQYSKAWNVLHVGLFNGYAQHTNSLVILKRTAGAFWKNPLAIDDADLFDELFFYLLPDDQMTILPYLRPWIFQHAFSSKRHRKSVTIYVRENDDDDDDEDNFDTSGRRPLRLLRGPLGAIRGETVDVFSIKGVDLGQEEDAKEATACKRKEETNEDIEDGVDESADEEYMLDNSLEDSDQEDEEEDFEDEFDDNSENEGGKNFDFEWIAKLRMVRDIKKSKVGSWWLIRGSFNWFMVNYYDEKCSDGQQKWHCKLYKGPNAGSGYLWEPILWDYFFWPRDSGEQSDLEGDD
jgi:hypothetical protein